jgi:hypothetical protein
MGRGSMTVWILWHEHADGIWGVVNIFISERIAMEELENHGGYEEGYALTDHEVVMEA